jgi:hypothetical protein
MAISCEMMVVFDGAITNRFLFSDVANGKIN